MTAEKMRQKILMDNFLVGIVGLLERRWVLWDLTGLLSTRRSSWKYDSGTENEKRELKEASEEKEKKSVFTKEESDREEIK